jgi:hypothetical protein
MTFLVFGVSFKIVTHHQKIMNEEKTIKDGYNEILWGMSEFLLVYGKNKIVPNK